MSVESVLGGYCEDLLPNFGEDEELDYGEDLSDTYPQILQQRRKSKEQTEAEKQAQAANDERNEKFRQVLAERQELRRKNIFLQKKMVEFFKKRKMDHVLKEDPKGLDLESKYLKRLYELQEYKKHVDVSREDMMQKSTELKEATSSLQQQVDTAQKEFFDRQEKVALSLQLKSRKRISAKAVVCFLTTQKMNADEINRLRLLEIREKRLLDQKQTLTRTLDSLGKGLQRADYELLNFVHENTVKLYEEKDKEAKSYEEKVTSVARNLSAVQKKAQHVEKAMAQVSQRCEESQAQMIEARQRLQKLKRMADHLRKEQKGLQLKSGLLTQETLLRDFEEGLAETNALWTRLEQANAALKRRLVSDRGGQVNTPEDYLGTGQNGGTEEDSDDEDD